MRFPRLQALLLLTTLVATIIPVAAADLGRLFTTREQRAELNDLRYQAKFAPPPEPTPAPVAQDAAPVEQSPVVDSMRINGVLRTSRGGGTIWLNRQQVERGGVTREGIQVTTGRKVHQGVKIQLPSGVDTILLKPGQKIDVATGSVLEAYEADPQADPKSAFATDNLSPAPEQGADSAGSGVQATPLKEVVRPDAQSATAQQVLDLLRGSANKQPDSVGKTRTP